MAYDKVVDSAVLDGYFSDIADAIRDKDGTQNTYTPAQMPQAIEDIPSGGGNEALMALLAGTATGEVTVTDVTDLSCTRISLGDTNNWNKVTKLTMPDLEKWCHENSNYAIKTGGLIDGCEGSTRYTAVLEELSLPKCQSLYIAGNNGMNSTNFRFTSLTTIYAPKLTMLVGDLAKSGLTSVNLPELTSISGAYMFRQCTSLVTVNLPKITNLMPVQSIFQSCTSLKTVTFGQVTNLTSNIFRDCAQLEGPIDFSYSQAMASQTHLFYGCTALQQVEFQNYGFIGPSVCQNSGIKAFIIRHRQESGILGLSNTNAFTGSPIADGTGYIYVPRDQIATYEAATNWSTYAGQFRALEDYTDDGTVDGEFIMPT